MKFYSKLRFFVTREFFGRMNVLCRGPLPIQCLPLFTQSRVRLSICTFFRSVIRHPTSAKYASMLKSMLKSLCPFHMSVTRHTTPIQSPPDAYFTDHYNLTDVKFLIMTQYPWGFPILERGSQSTRVCDRQDEGNRHSSREVNYFSSGTPLPI